MKRQQQYTIEDCLNDQKKRKLTVAEPIKSFSSKSVTTKDKPNETYLINDKENGAKVTFIANFLTKKESKALMKTILDTCEWSRDEFTIFGKTIPSPRRISAFGERNYKALYDNSKSYTNHHRRPPHDWIPEMQELKERVEKYTGETFTIAIINRYDGGQESIGWHSDKEKDLVAGSSIVSITLGAERDFQFKKITKEDEGKPKIITKELTDGSMVVMNSDTQDHYQHCVPKRKNVKGTRINITFRNVNRDLGK